MNTAFQTLTSTLSSTPQRWLVTGGAGFIGSHLIETLLNLDQEVTCLDNLATGYEKNLDAVRDAVTPERANLPDTGYSPAITARATTRTPAG